MKTTLESSFCDSCGKIVSSNYRDNLCFACHRNKQVGVGAFDIKTEVDLDDLQDVLNPTGKTPSRIYED